MNDRNVTNAVDDSDAGEGQSRSLAPLRSRGAKRKDNRSSRSSAKRSKRKGPQGGIHQRRNKRSNW